MREIKFRAWAVAAQVMFYPDGKDGWELYKGGLRALPNTILEQYTGLKDKNGKEIYEGDIVRYSSHFFGDSTEAEMDESVEWDNKDATYPWKLTNTGYRDGPDWCEIIGNIHEPVEQT